MVTRVTPSRISVGACRTNQCWWFSRQKAQAWNVTPSTRYQRRPSHGVASNGRVAWPVWPPECVTRTLFRNSESEFGNGLGPEDGV